MRLFSKLPRRAPQRKSASFSPRVETLERRELLAGDVFDFDSALTLGSDLSHFGPTAVATDAAGNKYLTGNFGGTQDFDPAGAHADDADILTARGLSDIFVAKYAPDNSLLWALRMGGDATASVSDWGQALAVDAVGNVFVTGHFMGTADFGSFTKTATSYRDGFVAKLTSGGAVAWASQWASAGYVAGGVTYPAAERGEGVAIDAAGNVYVSATTSFYTSWGSPLVYTEFGVRKYTPAGATAWGHHWNKSGTANSIAASAAGEVFVVGTISTGTVDFDPSTKTKNVTTANNAGYVLNLTTAGKFEWVTPFLAPAGAGASSVVDVAIDSSGKLFIGGSFGGAVDFDPGSGNVQLPSGVGNGFVAKLTDGGSYVWARAIGRNPTSIAVDAAANVYAVGSFRDTVDFDSGSDVFNLTSAGASDIFVTKVTSTGNFGWAGAINGVSDQVCYAVAADGAGTVHVAGWSFGTVDLDPTSGVAEVANAAWADAFLVTLTQPLPPPPALSIGSVSKQEGRSGTTAFVFTVNLSEASTKTIGVHYATADGTASKNSDYQAQSGLLTFLPGETTKTITILVTGDRTWEADENFLLSLDSPLNATLLNDLALGWILNDD